MLEKMRENQKRHYLNWRFTLQFQVGDLVLLKKCNADKMDFKWEPNYRLIKLSSSWSAVVENHTNGRTNRYNVGDLKLKYPIEDCELKLSPIGRAAKFVHHPDNLPDIDFKLDRMPEIKITAGTKYRLRRSIKAPKKLDM